MGPRSYKRGNISASLGLTSLYGSFNGAALLQARECSIKPHTDIATLASMGPRSYKRGNDAGMGGYGSTRQASMGPRSYKRGNGP